MKKSEYLAIVLSLAALSGCRGALTPDQKKYDLCCPAKSVYVEASSMEFSHKAVFDKRGDLEKVTYYNEDGSFRYEDRYAHDKAHHLLETIHVGEDGTFESRHEYKYDGAFVSECIVYGMNTEEAHRWVHLNDGKHIVQTTYFNEGEPNYLSLKTFDGAMCEERTYVLPDSTLAGVATICYLSADSEDRVTSIRSPEVNLDIEYDPQTSLPVKTGEVVLDSDRNFQWVPDLDSNPQRYYKYEFDSRGNWVRRTEHRHPDSLEVAVVSREITY